MCLQSTESGHTIILVSSLSINGCISLSPTFFLQGMLCLFRCPLTWLSSTKAKSFFPTFSQGLGSTEGSELPVKTMAKKVLGTSPFLCLLSPYLLPCSVTRPKVFLLLLLELQQSLLLSASVTRWNCTWHHHYMLNSLPAAPGHFCFLHLDLLLLHVWGFSDAPCSFMQAFGCLCMVFFFCWSGWPNPELGGEVILENYPAVLYPSSPLSSRIIYCGIHPSRCLKETKSILIKFTVVILTFPLLFCLGILSFFSWKLLWNLVLTTSFLFVGIRSSRTTSLDLFITCIKNSSMQQSLGLLLIFRRDQSE